jgi:type IV fimbrial biogenesis protein FimT
MKHASQTRFATAGFTLVELMITIVVMAIVLGLGVPSFMDTVRNNRIASASNEFVTSLTMARSEALKRGINVSVCVRDGDICSTTSTDWSAGWIVFTDDLAPSGQIDAPTDAVLMFSATSEANVEMPAGASSITFTPHGALSAESITVTKTGCKGKNKRVLSIQATGRISLSKEVC